MTFLYSVKYPCAATPATPFLQFGLLVATNDLISDLTIFCLYKFHCPVLLLSANIDMRNKSSPLFSSISEQIYNPPHEAVSLKALLLFFFVGASFFLESI